MPRDQWLGRLENARAQLRAAQDLLASADSVPGCDLIISQAIDATIAYGDTITVRFAGIRNAADRRNLGRTLKHAIGARFTPKQEERLERILGEKDSAVSGDNSTTLAESREFLRLAERFAEWAEAELARP